MPDKNGSSWLLQVKSFSFADTDLKIDVLPQAAFSE